MDDTTRVRAEVTPQQFAGAGAGNDAPDALVHQANGCLTAIRDYAAGARKALTNGCPEKANFAFDRIDTQIGRAHSLLATARANTTQR